MKKIKFLLVVAMLATISTVLPSCSDDPKDDTYCLNITSLTDIPYTESGVWTDVLNPQVGVIAFGDFIVTHYAAEEKYGDYSYLTWWGFSPSVSTDITDYSETTFIGEHEWSSITGGGVLGKGSAYLVGYYNAYKDAENSPSCGIAFTEFHYPQRAYITNNTYGYYAMKNGSAFNKKFEASDWTKVIFIGILDGKETGRVESYLAQNGKILDTWQEVNLLSLGKVNYVKMIMDSSDKGEHGINVPTYFCLDNYTVKL